MKHLLLVALAVGAFLAADVTGSWTGTMTPTDGNESHPAHAVLKQEGGTVTGTAGPNASEQHPIQNGRAADGTLTFEVAADESLMSFVGKQDGDRIEGELTRERDGQKQKAKLVLARNK